MKNQHLKVVVSAGLISLGMVGSANAMLVERLGGLAYYDTDANLTWVADANLALTSGYSVANQNFLGVHADNISAFGNMGWNAANDWVAGLSVAGVTGWRLADTLQPDASCSNEFNCTGSELGNMFYNVLGGVAGSSISTTHNANYDLFSNIQSDNYWSRTVTPVFGNPWFVGFHQGSQYNNVKTFSLYPWAVQSGDIGVSAVPVPAAAWLFGSGLLGLVGVARRK